MKEIKFAITDELGLHARPAGQLVKAAAGFRSQIQITAHGTTVDAKRIMGVMCLAVKQGEEILIRCEGEDEEAAAAALSSLMQQQF